MWALGTRLGLNQNQEEYPNQENIAVGLHDGNGTVGGDEGGLGAVCVRGCKVACTCAVGVDVHDWAVHVRCKLVRLRASGWVWACWALTYGSEEGGLGGAREGADHADIEGERLVRLLERVDKDEDVVDSDADDEEERDGREDGQVLLTEHPAVDAVR